MSRSGTRKRAAPGAYKRFAPAKPCSRRDPFPAGGHLIGAPMRSAAWGLRDIILAGCLINYYAQ